MLKFTMYNKQCNEEVFVYIKKELITSVVEYPNYYTIHFSSGGNFESSYKVKKDVDVIGLIEKNTAII